MLLQSQYGKYSIFLSVKQKENALPKEPAVALMVPDLIFKKKKRKNTHKVIHQWFYSRFSPNSV